MGISSSGCFTKREKVLQHKQTSDDLTKKNSGELFSNQIAYLLTMYVFLIEKRVFFMIIFGESTRK